MTSKTIFTEEELSKLPIEYQFLTFVDVEKTNIIGLKDIEVNFPPQLKFRAIKQTKPISKILIDLDE